LGLLFTFMMSNWRESTSTDSQTAERFAERQWVGEIDRAGSTVGAVLESTAGST